MTTPSLHEAAVLLNANARKVTRSMLHKAEDIVPRAQLYVSHSFEEARHAVRDIVDKGHSLVFCGGGDGTLVSTINTFKSYVDEKNRALQDAVTKVSFPTLGVLKMGTGNGIAGMIGNMKGMEPLAALRRGFAAKTKRLNLIEAEDRHFHFAGLGWDARIINDYVWFKNRFQSMPLAGRLATGFAGYVGAIATRTVPRELVDRRPVVRVISEGGEVYERRMNQTPRRLPIRNGDTIYEGPLSVMGAGTTPFYGYNMVAFPFALEREGFMHLRVVSASVFECLSHCVSIFKGRYQSDGFHDFLVKKVRFEFDRPTPLQIGGDAMGLRERISFAYSDFAVNLLDFSAA